MRIPVICTDVERYIENPRSFLPERVVCLNNPAHKPTWHGCWKRGLVSDHVHATNIPICRAYCEPCHETISYWPVFVLPYQREPLETIEGAMVEHLSGNSTRKIADETGYDPRTVSRWIKITLNQSLNIFYQAVRRILRLIGTEILPLSFTGAKEAAKLLLVWLHELARKMDYPYLNRLMGLCNLIGKGDWDLWGAKLGKGRSRGNKVPAPG